MARKKSERADGTVLIGRNSVREAIEKGSSVEKVLIQQGAGGPPVDQIRRVAERAGVPVQYVPLAKLTSLAAGGHHQGVIALSSPVPYRDVDDLLEGIGQSLEEVQQKKPILILLDQIQDPQNYGAILRTCVAAGVSGVIVTAHHMAPLSTSAIKASAGTALRIPIARVTNLSDTILQLKERGYWIVGAMGEAPTSIWEMDWDRPLAIVIGSEGEGIRKRVADTCDYLVRIPLPGDVESLNASVAAGVVLFEAVRKRANA